MTIIIYLIIIIIISLSTRGTTATNVASNQKTTGSNTVTILTTTTETVISPSVFLVHRTIGSDTIIQGPTPHHTIIITLVITTKYTTITTTVLIHTTQYFHSIIINLHFILLLLHLHIITTISILIKTYIIIICPKHGNFVLWVLIIISSSNTTIAKNVITVIPFPFIFNLGNTAITTYRKISSAIFRSIIYPPYHSVYSIQLKKLKIK